MHTLRGLPTASDDQFCLQTHESDVLPKRKYGFVGNTAHYALWHPAVG